MTIDANLSISSEITFTDLTRTDWIEWETDNDGILIYKAVGFNQTVAESTLTLAGNLEDGITGNWTETITASSDVAVTGTPSGGPPPAEASSADSQTQTKILDRIQLGLDVAGLIPGFGEPLDLINAGVSAARGNYGDAAVSIAAMVPFLGAAATGGKLFNKAGKAIAKNLDKVDEVAVGVSKYGDELTEQILNQPCFPAGTPILTAMGWKPIEEIVAGDVVLSRSEQDVNAPVGPQTVEEAHQRQGEILTLTIGGQKIQTTTEHPFWVKERGWVEACELRSGDQLSTSSGNWTGIEAVSHDGEIATVYNMTVKNWHTYFIGEPTWNFDVWVHNNHAGGTGYRALNAEDAAAIKAGRRITPKSDRGDILDHIQGRDSKYISISMTENGTARYIGSNGVVEIDLGIALETGSGLVPHKQVLQVAKKRGTPRDVQNVKASLEVLLTNGLDPRAIIGN